MESGRPFKYFARSAQAASQILPQYFDKVFHALGMSVTCHPVAGLAEICRKLNVDYTRLLE